MRVLFFLAGCVLAQTGIEAPGIGTMLDASGELRPVYGVAGNFTLGAPVEASETLPGLVLVTSHGVVYTEDSWLVLRRADASEIRFALRGVTGLRAMSADWVQAIAGQASFALRIELGREGLYALPGGARKETRRR